MAAQASTTFVVPRITCSGNPAGHFAGQALGVLFLSNYNGTTGPGYGPGSVVQAYCTGKTAHYDAEFYLPNAADTNSLPVSRWGASGRANVAETSVQVSAPQLVEYRCGPRAHGTASRAEKGPRCDRRRT